MSAQTPARRRRATGEKAKAARREQIIAAAKRVFARKGYQATTIADVAKESGLAYGSIYWYFSSKEDLFHALMESEEAALRAQLGTALDGLSPDALGATGFRTAVRATFEFFESDRATVKLLFRDAYALGDHFEKHLFGIYERFIAEIEVLVITAQESGEIVAAPPRVVAFSLAALIGQLAKRRLSTDDGLDAEVVAEFVVSLVLDGLRPRPVGLDRVRPDPPRALPDAVEHQAKGR